jgi:hypothetical protein
MKTLITTLGGSRRETGNVPVSDPLRSSQMARHMGVTEQFTVWRESMPCTATTTSANTENVEGRSYITLSLLLSENLSKFDIKMLCDICQKITFRSLVGLGDPADIITAYFTTTEYIGQYLFYQHQLSIAKLYSSQLEGCHFDAFLWFAFEEYGSPVVTALRSLAGV